MLVLMLNNYGDSFQNEAGAIHPEAFQFHDWLGGKIVREGELILVSRIFRENPESVCEKVARALPFAPQLSCAKVNAVKGAARDNRILDECLQCMEIIAGFNLSFPRWIICEGFAGAACTDECQKQ